MPQEIEIKLAVPASEVRRMTTLPVLRSADARTDRPLALRTTYFDTPDLRLARAGIALRVRRQGRRWIQAVKLEDAGAGGLHRRAEFEADLAAAQPDLAAIPDSDVRASVLRRLGRRQPVPLFTTSFGRRTWRVTTREGTLEVALDRGEIRAGDRVEPICELEIELKTGAPAAAFRVAREIASRIAAQPFDRSKFERGLGLSTPQAAATMPDVAPLDPDASPAAALSRIAADCIRALQAEQAGMLVAYDAACVHQMRVALRRLGSAWRLFRSAVPVPPVAEEARWLRRTLGASRDWDVFFDAVLLPATAAFPTHAGLASLNETATAERSRTRGHTLEAVRSARYRLLVLDLAEWASALGDGGHGSELGPDPEAPPIAAFARRVVRKRWSRVRRDLEHLSAMSPEERHGARIHAKRLRYALEFFRDLLPEARYARLHKRAKKLQTRLGAANDLVTANRLIGELRRMLPAPSPAEIEALGLLVGWCAREERQITEKSAQLG